MATRAISQDNRREPRLAAECKATARIALCVEILDASHRGVRARISVPLPVGTTLKIGLPGGTERHAKIAWSEGELFGCEFMAPLSPAELAKLLAATPLARASI